MRFKHFLAGLGALLLISCENSSDFKKTDSASQTYPETPASTFEHLKELNWLAGSWVEKDRDYVTSNVISWNATKTILTQYFSIKVGGKKKLEGQQIIAWDPAEKKMRSWIFDSDGGIGRASGPSKAIAGLQTRYLLFRTGGRQQLCTSTKRSMTKPTPLPLKIAIFTAGCFPILDPSPL